MQTLNAKQVEKVSGGFFGFHRTVRNYWNNFVAGYADQSGRNLADLQYEHHNR